MWLRTNANRIVNLENVAFISKFSGNNENGEPIWIIRAYFNDGKEENWYLSKEEEHINTVFENLNKVIGAGCAINLNKPEQESSDA